MDIEDVVVGLRVMWHDPDEDPETDCSGAGVVTAIASDTPHDLSEETMVSVAKDDGGEVECLADELTRA